MTDEPSPDGGGPGKALRWMPYALLAGLLLVVIKLVAVPISNTDTFFHLRYGHEFLNGWSPWSPGHVSSFGQQDWVPTQWLSQIAMAATESVFGLAGVAWLAGALIVALVLAVYFVCRRYADPLPAVVVTIVVVVGTLANLSPRPQVISYLLVLLVTHAWLRAAEDLRAPWWIVPATWGWALLHGMWVIGIAIGLVAVVGIVLDRRRELRELRPRLLRLLAVPVLSLVVAGLTPVGPKLYGAVLLVSGRSKFHAEWQPTDFHDHQALAVVLLVVTVLVVWVRRTGDARPDWVRVLLLLLAAAWCAYAFRTVSVAAVMTAPLAAEALQSVVGRRRARPRRERSVVLGLGATTLVLLAAVVPFTSAQAASVPSWLNPALDRLPDGTKVQNVDTSGGYLMWRHPELDFAIDGYSDAYTTRHLQSQLDLQRLRPGWDTSLQHSGVTYALLPTESALAYALTHQEGWRTMHTSKDVVMLEAPDGWAS